MSSVFIFAVLAQLRKTGKTLTTSVTPRKWLVRCVVVLGCAWGCPSPVQPRHPASGETTGSETICVGSPLAIFRSGRPSLLLRLPTSVCPPWPPLSLCHG